MAPAQRPFPPRKAALLCGILLFLARPIAARAGYGDLDPGFGGTGFVLSSFPQITTDRGNAAVLQTDGKLVVVAATQTPDPVSPHFLALRYNTDGSLDGSFGTDGVVGQEYRATFPGSAYAVALTTTGGILVAGDVANREAFVWKFTSAGVPDSSFGVNGVALVVEVGVQYTARTMAVQADGKIVLAGFRNLDMVVMRLTSDGQLDSTFGSGGIVSTSVDAFSNATAVAVQVDGKIVATGSYSATFGGGMFLARYDTNGTLDSGFGSGGIVKTSNALNRYAAYAVTLQTSDTAPTKIVVAGSVSIPFSGIQVLLARYNLDGSLDTTLGTGGIAIPTIGGGGNSVATSVRIVYSGGIPSRILVSGSSPSTAGGSLDIFAARFLLTGTLDTAFDGDGVAFAPFPGNVNETGSAMVRTNAADIVVVGTADPWGPDLSSDVATVRFHSNGALDTTWDTDGIRRDSAKYPLERSTAEAISFQPDGKIVTVGSVFPTPNVNSAALGRYGPDGVLDSTLSGDGLASTNTASESYDCAVLPDGKILACGRQAADSLFTILRYLPDGSPDSSFSGDGVFGFQWTGPGGSQLFGTLNALAVQPDGNVVVTGDANLPLPAVYHNVLVARLLSTGSFDTTFWLNLGSSQIVPGALSCAGREIALDPDGNVYVAGDLQTSGGTYEFFVLKLLPDGRRDNTFDGDGLVRTPFGTSSASLSSMAIQPDGRILVGGRWGGAGIGLVRYDPDGALDTTFGTDGFVTTSRAGINEYLGAVALLPSGKIVVVAAWNWSSFFNYYKAGFVGYDSSGNIDASLGDSGFADLNLIPGAEQYLRDLVVDANGDLVFSGYLGHFTDSYQQLVGRIRGPSDLTPVPIPAMAPTPFALGSVYPNPTRGAASLQFTSAPGLGVEADVVDVAGRRVRTLRSASEPASTGSGSLRWDGDADDGRPVASGVYFLRVRQGERTGTRSVTILR